LTELAPVTATLERVTVGPFTIVTDFEAVLLTPPVAYLAVMVTVRLLLTDPAVKTPPEIVTNEELSDQVALAVTSRVEPSLKVAVAA
jgi:hypothetical protein